MYSSLFSLGKFIPRYFIFFCYNGEWDWFLNFSNISLLVYRNASDFCVLIFYPEILLNLLISSSNYLIISLGFLCIVSCHQQTVSFTSSFPIWIPFISFSSLIAVARTSKTMLNNSGKSGTLVLFLILGWIHFFPLRIMFAVGLSYMAFIMLR